MTIKKSYKRIALIVSLCLLALWCLIGAGTSLAWFTDTTPVQKNVFHVDMLNMEVSHRLDDGTYEKVDATTSVFDDQAIYEPGYVQVVYLKVENTGTVPFNYKMAVSTVDYRTAINVFGQQFNLQDYLKFGLVSARTEAELEALVDTRVKAENIATMDIPLSTYTTASAPLGAGETDYVALIVRMPQEVDNMANHRNPSLPYVDLGLIATATQVGAGN